jgi:hypothetical protein
LGAGEDAKGSLSVSLSGSFEVQPTVPEVDRQATPGEKVETEQPVDAGTGREGVAEHRERATIATESEQARHRDQRRVLDTTTGRHLHPLRSERRIVAGGDEGADVDHRARGSGIQGEMHQGAARRPVQLGTDDDQAGVAVESKGHTTMAVPSGIRPV